MMLPAASVADDWPKLLRRACRVLSSTPDALIRSISVTVLAGEEGEGLAILQTLGRRLAEEYVLSVLVEQHGRSVPVRFFRRSQSEDHQSPDAPDRKAVAGADAPATHAAVGSLAEVT